MIPVKVIDGNKENLLIEWKDDQGDSQRSMVPKSTLIKTDEGTFHPFPLEGVPYGVDWSSFEIDVDALKSAIVRQLRNNGIFTAGDLRKDPNTARSILLNLAGLTISNLIHFAERDEQG